MRAEQPSDLGFTLTEVLVAMLILTSGAVSAATLFVISTASTRVAREETQTSLLAAAKIEQLQSLVWSYDSAGAPISDTSTDLSVEPPINGGVGLRTSPVDALERNCAGYVDYLDGEGQWVGTGSAPPPQATYVRRWSIQPLGQFPNEGLVMQVLVTTVVRAGSPISSTSASRGSPVALAVVRVRQTR